MRITLAAVRAGGARVKAEAAHRMFEEYVKRAGRYCAVEAAAFPSEAALIESAARRVDRLAANLVLLDSHGRMQSSEEFARYLGRMQDEGTQRVLFGIGPADGWSEESRVKAHLLLSLGKMTLPHELARVVLAEQVYRALTILAGHPYHCGH